MIRDALDAERSSLKAAQAGFEATAFTAKLQGLCEILPCRSAQLKLCCNHNKTTRLPCDRRAFVLYYPLPGRLSRLGHAPGYSKAEGLLLSTLGLL